MNRIIIFVIVLVATLSFLSAESVFSGQFTWDRFTSGRLYLCEQKGNIIQGSYAREIDGSFQIVGVIEGRVNEKKKSFEGVFVDAGGISGDIILAEKNGKISGNYWPFQRVQGFVGFNIQGEKIANVSATSDQCLSSNGESGEIANMAGTWVYSSDNVTGTWCVNGNSVVGDNAFFENQKSVFRGQAYLNGRVWSGVWLNNDIKSSFETHTAGAFLKVRTTDSNVHEIQYFIEDGAYYNVSGSGWSVAGAQRVTLVSNATESCVAPQNQLPWMGTFDINEKSQLRICYTSGSTVSGSIASIDSNNVTLYVRGSVYGSVSADGKSLSGWWYDVTDKKPYYGQFTIELDGTNSAFTGHKYYGDAQNSTQEWKGTRSKTLGLFANDETCTIAASQSHLLEGTWTNEASPLNQGAKWSICLGAYSGQTIKYSSQKDLLDGIVDRSKAIAAGVSEHVRVISIVRQVDTVIESHYWSTKYLGSTLNERLDYSRPANKTCFAITPKDNRVAVAVAASIPIGLALLFCVVLLPYLGYQLLVKKKEYVAIA